MAKLLWGIFLFTGLAAFGQDLQSVQGLIASNDYATARKQIDGYFHQKKTTAEPAAWYYKGRIYTELAGQPAQSSVELLQEAFKAYKRYQELDPKNRMMQLNDNRELFQLYDLAYNTAADAYNSKNYQPAFQHFRLALEMEEYFHKKAFTFQGKTFPAMDTSLINLTGSAAYFSNREAEAIPYFEKLANARISGEEYKGVYALLYQYYLGKNEPVKASKYLLSGQELIPDPGFWIRIEWSSFTSMKDRFAHFERLLQKYPANTPLKLDYAGELFHYVWSEPKPDDVDSRTARLHHLLSQVLEDDQRSARANFLLSQHVYKQLLEIEETWSSMKDDSPSDQARKKALGTKLDQKYEEMLGHSLRAYEQYAGITGEEAKGYCRKVLNQMIRYYQKKEMADKVQYYGEKLKNL